MNALDLMDALTDIQSKYILEAQKSRERYPARHAKWKVLLIAAAMALLLAGCAYVVLRMQNLKIGQWVPNPAFMDETERNKHYPPKDVISLQGYAGSPGYQAIQEWLEFENTYDPDGSLVMEADQNRYSAPEAYDSFFCFTQEMQDKVDEICETYNLKLPGRRIHAYGPEKYLFPQLGIRGIHLENAKIDSYFDGGCYYYANGSFHIPGNLTLTEKSVHWPYKFVYGYRYTNKAYFDGGYLTVNDIDSFDQWEYVSADGTQLLLAINPETCLVLADRGDAFISISVYYPGLGEIPFGEEPMTHEALEAFADAFDYSIRPLGLGAAFPSYADFLSNLTPVPTPWDTYALRDLDGDGKDELLVTRNGHFEMVLTMEEEQAKILYFSPDGLFLTRDNILMDCSNQDGWETYRMVKFQEGKPRCIEYVGYDALKGTWAKSVSLGDKPWLEVPISQDEAYDLIDRYPLVPPTWIPIPDFPGYSGPHADVPTPAELHTRTPEELGRDAVTNLEYFGEGPVQLPTTLFTGPGYSIYIPDEYWISDHADEEAGFSDIWTSAFNSSVELKVSYFPMENPDGVRALLKEQESLYNLTDDKQGGLLGSTEDREMLLIIRMFETRDSVFTLSCRYPMEAAEGFGTQLSVLADTFRLND